MRQLRRRLIITAVTVLIGAWHAWSQTYWYSRGDNPVASNLLDPSVLYDSTTGRYSMWFVVSNSGVKRAVSSDGSQWYFGDDLVLAPGSAGTFDRMIYSVGVVRYGDQYLMYYTASRDGDSLSIGLATSQDGEHWQKSPSSPVLSHGPAGSWDSRHISGAEVRFADGLFQMWFGGTGAAGLSTGLAVSTDGVSWTKDLRNPILPHGGPGTADARQAGVVGVSEREGLLHMLYRGIDEAGNHSYCLATSQNGTDWRKWSGNPVKRGKGWDGTSLGGGTLLWHEGLFHLWYCGAYGSAWGLGEAVSPYDAMVLAVRAEKGTPVEYTLQNYPNPFNPSTTIQFGLPQRSRVTLTIFNALGQEVATIRDEEFEAGHHEVEFVGAGLSSGAYYCRMNVGNLVQMRKLLLLR